MTEAEWADNIDKSRIERTKPKILYYSLSEIYVKKCTFDQFIAQLESELQDAVEMYGRKYSEFQLHIPGEDSEQCEDWYEDWYEPYLEIWGGKIETEEEAKIRCEKYDAEMLASKERQELEELERKFRG